MNNWAGLKKLAQNFQFHNQNQLLKSWTLSFRDSITGHMLVLSMYVLICIYSFNAIYYKKTGILSLIGYCTILTKCSEVFCVMAVNTIGHSSLLWVTCDSMYFEFSSVPSKFFLEIQEWIPTCWASGPISLSLCCPTPNWFGVEHDQIEREKAEKMGN